MRKCKYKDENMDVVNLQHIGLVITIEFVYRPIKFHDSDNKNSLI